MTPFVIARCSPRLAQLALQGLEDPLARPIGPDSFHLAFHVVAIGYLLRYVFNWR
jgi:hypothetical protein